MRFKYFTMQELGNRNEIHLTIETIIEVGDG